MQANASLPISERSWHLELVRFPSKLDIASWSSFFQSEVIEASIAGESSKMPRSVMEVEGPSVFSCLMGIKGGSHDVHVVLACFCVWRVCSEKIIQVMDEM